MARFATPGVYIKEKSAFGSSVVAVPTAVPAFIGYTEKAARGNNSLINKPTRVSSFAEYVTMFGGAPQIQCNLKHTANSTSYEVSVNAKTQYNLFNAVKMFYANGGGTCYIVSVGDYSGGVKANELNDLENNGGLQTLMTEQEPTLVVIPDATLLSKEECYSIYSAMLQHCGGDTQSRFAILDVYDGYKARTYDDNDVVDQFREMVGNNFLAFGAAYYPWIKTTVVGASEIDYSNISDTKALVSLLTAEAQLTHLGAIGGGAPSAAPKKKPEGGDDKKAAPAKKAAAAAPAADVDDKTMKKYNAVVAEINKLNNAAAGDTTLHQTLLAISASAYKSVLGSVRGAVNLMAPSGAMAGVISRVDNTQGVFKAPANVGMSSVVAPSQNMTNEDQEDLNTPINGKSVNAIRTFMGKGVLVWGARTMDGNSQDWKYISVRRTLIMLEQSIKNAVEPYVFEANTPQTWLRIKVSIDNFLASQWRAGALVGTSPNEAFETTVGLGSTMTPADILDGIMRISVKVAVTRPAEFIEITFEQMMPGGGGDEGGEEGGEE